MVTIIVYSTPACPYCAMAKQFLEENNIHYVEHDVSTNQEKAREMVEKSGQTGVPVLDINGKIIIGFDVAKIREALNLK